MYRNNFWILEQIHSWKTGHATFKPVQILVVFRVILHQYLVDSHTVFWFSPLVEMSCFQYIAYSLIYPSKTNVYNQKFVRICNIRLEMNCKVDNIHFSLRCIRTLNKFSTVLYNWHKWKKYMLLSFEYFTFVSIIREVWDCWEVYFHHMQLCIHSIHDKNRKTKCSSPKYKYKDLE